MKDTSCEFTIYKTKWSLPLLLYKTLNDSNNTYLVTKLDI